MKANWHGNTFFNNGYGFQTQDFGNANDAQGVNFDLQNQSNGYHSAEKIGYQ